MSFSTFSSRQAKALLEQFLSRELNDLSNDLDDRWYQTGQNDFSLYGGDEYLYCLLKAHGQSYRHARLALSYIQKQPQSPINILDAGTGLGLFAALLATALPSTRVVGTNLPGRQLDFNLWLAEFLDLPNLSFVISTNGLFDTIMALEYLEHFQTPDVELKRLVNQHDPHTFIESSSLSHRAVGHFDHYTIAGHTIAGPLPTGKKGAGPAYRAFTKCFQMLGFRRQPLSKNSWQLSRPRIWHR